VAQKVIRIGNSLGVTIAPEVARAYGLELGSTVVVEPTKEGLLVQPATIRPGLSLRQKTMVKDLIKRHRSVLDALARDERP